MERYNDNIDEFFKMSLESFNDAPSDAVWEKIDGRLASDVTLWSTIISLFTKYFWYIILGSTLVSYHFYSQHQYRQLTDEMSIIDEKYDNLESKFLAINTENAELKNKNFTTEKSLSNLENMYMDQNVKLQSFRHNYEELNSKFNAFRKNMKMNDFGNELSNAESFYKNPLAGNFFHKYKINNSLNVDDQGSRFGSMTKPSSGIVKLMDNISGESKSNENSEKEIMADRSFQLAAIKKDWDLSRRMREHTSILQKRLRSGLNLSIFEDEGLEIKAFKYRYGANLSTINVITNSADKRNFGISIGFVHELGITKKWSLTNSIQYSLSNYEIDNGTEQLTSDELANVPGASSFQDPVKEVEVNSQYFDFNIGISRRFHIGKQGRNLFINPSIGWQFYMPQEFQYTFLDGNKSIFDERRFIGYFGTAKVLIGYEMPISEDLRIQLGMYGEKSLIEQGKELRHRVNAGLSGSLYFGN